MPLHEHDGKPVLHERMLTALLCTLAALIVPVLYLLRQYDDNRLTGWGWVFGDGSAHAGVMVWPVLCAVMVAALAAYVLSAHERLLNIKWAAVLVFPCCMVFWMMPEVIVDASRYFTQAKYLELYGTRYFLSQWGGQINAWTDMPLMPFLYGLVFSGFGEDRQNIQFITTVCFALSVWLTWAVARDLFDREGEEPVALYGAFMLLAVPYLYTQVPLLMVDVACMFLLVLSLFTFQRYLISGGWGRGALFVLSVLAMLFSKYSQWMMALSLVVLFLYRLSMQPGITLRRTAPVLALSLLLFAVGLWYFRGITLEQMELLRTFQRPGLRRWGESYVSTFLFQTHPFVSLCVVIAMIQAVRRRDPRVLVISFLLILIMIMQIKRIRYTIPLFPLIALTAGYGLHYLKTVGSWVVTPRLRRAAVLSAVLISFVIASGAYLPWLMTNNLINLKLAGEYLDRYDDSTDEVIVRAMPQRSTINPAVAVPMLDYYTRRTISYHYDLRPNMSQEKIDNLTFRFTWTYENPAYYEDFTPSADAPVALIAFEPPEYHQAAMRGYKLLKRFDVSEGIYRYKPFVNIYKL